MGIQKITLKGWINCSNLGGTSGIQSAKQQISELLSTRFSSYKEKPAFGQPDDYINSDKVYIYGHYWRGEWSSPTVEHFTTLYKPKCATV